MLMMSFVMTCSYALFVEEHLRDLEIIHILLQKVGVVMNVMVLSMKLQKDSAFIEAYCIEKLIKKKL